MARPRRQPEDGWECFKKAKNGKHWMRVENPPHRKTPGKGYQCMILDNETCGHFIKKSAFLSHFRCVHRLNPEPTPIGRPKTTAKERNLSAESIQRSRVKRSGEFPQRLWKSKRQKYEWCIRFAVNNLVAAPKGCDVEKWVLMKARNLFLKWKQSDKYTSTIATLHKNIIDFWHKEEPHLNKATILKKAIMAKKPTDYESDGEIPQLDLDASDVLSLVLSWQRHGKQAASRGSDEDDAETEIEAQDKVEDEGEEETEEKAEEETSQSHTEPEASPIAVGETKNQLLQRGDCVASDETLHTPVVTPSVQKVLDAYSIENSPEGSLLAMVLFMPLTMKAPPVTIPTPKKTTLGPEFEAVYREVINWKEKRWRQEYASLTEAYVTRSAPCIAPLVVKGVSGEIWDIVPTYVDTSADTFAFLTELLPPFHPRRMANYGVTSVYAFTYYTRLVWNPFGQIFPHIDCPYKFYSWVGSDGVPLRKSDEKQLMSWRKRLRRAQDIKGQHCKLKRELGSIANYTPLEVDPEPQKPDVWAF